MTFLGNSLGSLSFPGLLEIDGTLLIVSQLFSSQDASHMFDILSSVSGNLEFRGNSGVTNLTFPALTDVIGSIIIADNQDLVSLGFGFDVGSLNLEISNNPKLSEVFFDYLTTFTGKLLIRSTTTISLNLSKLTQLSLPSVLQIQLPSPSTVDLSQLACASFASVFVTRDTNVTLPACGPNANVTIISFDFDF